MRFSLALVVLSGALATTSALGLVRRQSFPTCAEECLANANLDGCNSDDDTCLCNSSAFVDSVTSCIQSSCTGSELTTAEQDAQQLCLAVGVTLTASSAASTGTSAASSGASAASSSASAASSGKASSASARPASSATSAAPSSSATKTSGAMSHGVNALAGLAAVGAVAFAL